MPTEGLSDLDTEQMYHELVDYYRRHSITAKREVNRLISEYMVKGMSRKEAILKLYSETFPGSALMRESIVKPRSLEEALRKLDAKASDVKALSSIISLTLLVITIFLSIANFVPRASPSLEGPVGLVVMAFLIISLFLLAEVSTRKLSWQFEESFTIEGAGGHLREVAMHVPKIFQTLTLEEIQSSVEDGVLTIKLNLRRTIQVQNSRGSITHQNVNLGRFVITARLTEHEGALVVKATYRGEEVPAGNASLAAEAYERLIVAFRSSVEEAWDRLKPRVTVTVDFVELAKLIASTGLVVTAVRCPYCGGSLKLPETGDTTKCPYCGSTIKAFDLYQLLKGLVKERA